MRSNTTKPVGTARKKPTIAAFSLLAYMPKLPKFVISDTHFDHANIVQFCSRPTDHNERMFDNWNRTVEPDDIVLHLGDVLFRPNSNAYLHRIRSLNGKRYMIRGNHDHKKDAYYEDLGFTVLPLRDPSDKNAMQGDVLIADFEGKRVAFSHVPCFLYENWDVNIHGHIHNGGYPTHVKAMEKDHRNVSVEVLGYYPALLTDVMNGAAYESVTDAPTNDLDERLNDMKRFKGIFSD